MNKKFVSLGIAAMLVLCLSACGNSNNPSTPPSTATPPKTDTPTPAPATVPEKDVSTEPATTEDLTKYPDGRDVEGNDYRFITPKDMKQRFMGKTEFIKDEKYNTYINTYPLALANQEYNRTRDILGIIDLFPDDFEDWTDFDKAMFAEVYYYPQFEMSSFGNSSGYDDYNDWKNRTIEKHIRYIDRTFPQDDENKEAYADALTEVYMYHLNNWFLDKTSVRNPYDEDYVPELVN